jgi:hypothetical protein
MHLSLTLHPDSRCAATTGIDVKIACPRPGYLLLRYFVTGNVADLRMPPVTSPARTDELWRHTCFEAFLCPSPGAAYYEFNFAPSTQWAAYRFSDYRSGIGIASGISAPRIETFSDGESYELQASLDLDGLLNLPGDTAWRLGLSAVIEEADGGMSYWALAHPPGKADFHHSDCFALELAPACRP